jgi:Phage integrase family
MAAFSLELGLWAANMTGLRWSVVELARQLAWAYPDEAKARKAIAVPRNGKAVASLQKQIGQHRDVVFTVKGQPVAQVSTAAWYKAWRQAGIENFRWHDLRHTWASWHVQSGTPLNVLQELGGRGQLRHGAAIRSPRSRSAGALGGPADRIEDSAWHKFGTTCGRTTASITRGACKPLILLKFLVGPA